MHIYGIKNSQRAETPRRIRRASSDGFSSMMDVEETSSVSSTADTAAVNSVSNILSLQEIDMEIEIKRENVQHGESILDSMDDLLEATLCDDKTSKQNALTNLNKELKKTKKDLSNDELDELLDSIKLRAAVELAKSKLKG